ncbi:asparaginase [Cooperia oncophora]
MSLYFYKKSILASAIALSSLLKKYDYYGENLEYPENEEELLEKAIANVTLITSALNRVRTAVESIQEKVDKMESQYTSAKKSDQKELIRHFLATNFAKQMGFKEEDLTTDVSRQMITKWRADRCQPNFWQIIRHFLATNFAKQMGFKEEDLTTDVSRQMITKWRADRCQPNFWQLFQNVSPDPSTSCGPYRPNIPSLMYRRYYNDHSRAPRSIDRFNHDTLGMVVVDSSGNIPGRIGDSPIPGAGAYAVEGVGGAAATGDGDILIRFLPSFYIVEQMRLGTKPFKAAHKAIRRILQDYPHFQGAVVAANAAGVHGAACANLGKFMFSVGEGGKTRSEIIACLPTKLSPESKSHHKKRHGH